MGQKWTEIHFWNIYDFWEENPTQCSRGSNGIKIDGDFFWNIYDFWEEKSTRDGARGGHEAGGAPLTLVGHP